MCHDGGWVTLMGGLRKKWCQSWHCDGSLSSTLVLKVFQVSKYAFLSWAYTRGGEGATAIWKCISVFIIGENWEHTLWNRQPGVQAGNVSILLSNLNPKDALAGVLNGLSSLYPNIYSQQGGFESKTWPSLTRSKYLWVANTAECCCSAETADVAEEINEQFTAWLLTILVIKAMRCD